MKQLAHLLFGAMILCLCGCAGDECMVFETTHSMDIGTTYNLTVSPQDSDWVYASLEPLIVTVSEHGLLTAMHVGKTNVKVSRKDSSFTKTVKVTVNGYYTNFAEPCLLFGSTIKQVKAWEKRSFMRQDILEDTTTLIYNPSSEDVQSLIYLFEGGKLKHALVFSSTWYSRYYFLERYQMPNPNKSEFYTLDGTVFIKIIWAEDGVYFDYSPVTE